MELTEIYTTLLQRNLVEDQYDFSTGWLGKCRSYYSAMNSLNRKPSIEVLATLQVRLKQKIKILAEHGQFEIQSKSTLHTIADLKVLTRAIDSVIQQRCSILQYDSSQKDNQLCNRLKTADSLTTWVL